MQRDEDEKKNVEIFLEKQLIENVERKERIKNRMAAMWSPIDHEKNILDMTTVHSGNVQFTAPVRVAIDDTPSEDQSLKMKCVCGNHDYLDNFIKGNFMIGNLGRLFICPKCGTARVQMEKVVELVLQRSR